MQTLLKICQKSLLFSKPFQKMKQNSSKQNMLTDSRNITAIDSQNTDSD